MPEAMSSMVDGSKADPSIDASGNKRKRVSTTGARRSSRVIFQYIAQRSRVLPQRVERLTETDVLMPFSFGLWARIDVTLDRFGPHASLAGSASPNATVKTRAVGASRPSKQRCCQSTHPIYRPAPSTKPWSKQKRKSFASLTGTVNHEGPRERKRPSLLHSGSKPRAA